MSSRAIVLDAKVLIRAVLGRKVLTLLPAHAEARAEQRAHRQGR